MVHTAPDDICSNCGAASASLLFEAHDVPVHVCVQYDTAEVHFSTIRAVTRIRCTSRRSSGITCTPLHAG